MPNDTEHDTGRWADRPERPERPSQYAHFIEEHRPPSRSVWREMIFIVVVFLTLAMAVARIV
jgi:hypothetical protein